MLDAGAGQAAVAGASQAVPSDVLREGGLDAGADGVSALPLLGLPVEPVQAWLLWSAAIGPS